MVLIVSTELAELLFVIETGLTLKLELVRLGKPLRLRLTLPVKALEGFTVMVSELLELTATVMVAEEAPRVKLPDEAALICNVTVVE